MYDPADNPRFMDEAPEVPPEIEVNRVEAMADLGHLTERLGLFNDPAWEIVKGDILAQLHERWGLLASDVTDTMEKVHRVRGEMQGLSWVLNYPEETRKAVESLRMNISAMEAMTAEAEGEEEVP